MEFILSFCLLLGTSLGVGFGAEFFLDEPPDHIVAIQGDTILFRCGVGSHVDATLSWKDIDTSKSLSKAAGIDPEQIFQKSTRERLRVIGDRQNGEYHLQIRNVVGEDGGRYACYYFDAETGTDRHSNIVTLTVMTPPAQGYPKCTTEPAFSQKGVGDNVTLVCESRGGNPPAALTWIRNREILDVMYTPGNARALNRHEVTLTQSDMDVRYVCLARNPATKQPLSCSVKPLRSRIGVRIQPSTQKIIPGQQAVYTCVAEVVPGLVYTWYVNDRRVDDSHRRYKIKRSGMRLKVYPVIPSDDFSLVTCIVEQPIAEYDLSGTATALLWVDLEAETDFVWETTTVPPLPSTSGQGYTLPDFIYNGINLPTEMTTEPTPTPPAPTPPAGIHRKGESTGIDISIDVNTLLETLIDPDLIEPVIPERDPTLVSLEELPGINDTSTTTMTTTTTTIAPMPTDRLTTVETNEINDKPRCRGDACITPTSNDTSTNNNTLSNEIHDAVTPPREGGVGPNYDNEIKPVSSAQQSSKGTAIGLSLGLIFLTILVLIIVFVVWRKQKDAKQKDAEKQKPKPKAKTAPKKK